MRARCATGVGFGVAAVVLTLVPAALAQPAGGEDTEACVAAHLTAQRLRRDGRLRAAKESLVACSRSSCPQVLVEECGPWLREVEQTLPTIVFEAVGPDGLDVADARVLIDGEVLVERLDGKAVEVDPGEHVLRYERAGWPSIEQMVLFREGDKGRRVAVRFERAPPKALEPVSQPRPTPLIAYGLAGLGAVGVGLFATMGAVGLSQRNDLDDLGCKPNCATSDVDDVRRSFLIGDIALATGVAAIGAAVVVYLTRPAVPAPTIALRVGTGRRPDGVWALVEASY